MTFFDRDLFQIWRWTLGVAVSIYVIVITLKWLASWMVFLGEPRRERELMRRYLFLHLLRLRGSRFRSELIRIVAYGLAIVVVYWLHDFV